MNHFKIIQDNNDIQKMKEKLDLLNEKEDESVMYILVNNELKMEKGKISGQCCHSACRITRLIENGEIYTGDYQNWVVNFEPKIILKATKKDLEYCIENYNFDNQDNMNKEIWCVSTRDIGRTQIETGSLTTVAFCPIKRKNVPDFIKKLKLL